MEVVAEAHLPTVAARGRGGHQEVARVAGTPPHNRPDMVDNVAKMIWGHALVRNQGKKVGGQLHAFSSFQWDPLVDSAFAVCEVARIGTWDPVGPGLR